jgi:hypothetical protein
MDIELLQSGLRYLSAVVATVLGIVALLTSPRDEQTGKLTIHGKQLLFGIALSGLVAITLQIADDVKLKDQQQAESVSRQHAAANATELRNQITRANYPLQEPVLTYAIWVEENHIPISPYLRRIDAIAQRDNTLIKWQGICRGEPTYPNPKTEREIYRAAQLSYIRLDLYKRPVHLNNFAAYVIPGGGPRGSEAVPDLTFILKPGAEGDFSDCFKLASNGKDDARLMLHGVASAATRSSTLANGTITSLTDLTSAQLFVTFFSEASEAAEINLASVRINFGSVGAVTLKSDTLRVHRIPYSRAHLVYEYRFPPTFEKILESMQLSAHE